MILPGLFDRLESADDRPVDDPGRAGRRRAGADGRAGRGRPGARGGAVRPSRLTARRSAAVIREKRPFRVRYSSDQRSSSHAPGAMRIQRPSQGGKWSRSGLFPFPSPRIPPNPPFARGGEWRRTGPFLFPPLAKGGSEGVNSQHPWLCATQRLRALNHLARFREGEPPGEPSHPARTEPRPPGITKGHLDQVRRDHRFRVNSVDRMTRDDLRPPKVFVFLLRSCSCCAISSFPGAGETL